MGPRAARPESDDQQGPTRRRVIQAAAGAGVAAWTAPMILDSFTSPAGATSGLGMTCSYVMIAFTYAPNGQQYSMKIDQGSTGCNGDNNTSNDAGGFGTSCGGTTYDNFGSGTALRRGGSTITPWPGSPTCSSLFIISGNTVTARPGVTIDFAVAHDGQFKKKSGDPFEHFSPVCGPLTQVTYDRCRGD